MQKIAKIAAVTLVIALALVVAAPAKAATQAELEAMIAKLQAEIAAMGGSAASTDTTPFEKSLKLGSRGDDVERLQLFLEDKGLLDTNGVYGYFGPKTKKAVADYQKENDITPAAGYFGPVTREAVNAELEASADTGTGTGTGTGSTPSTGTSTPASAPAEGTVDIKLAASPADNANIQTSVDVPVYGLEIKARQSDMTVERIDLKVAVVDSNSATENPASFIKEIKVKDGDTVLADITAPEFTKDSSSVYYTRLTGLNFKVAKGATKTLVVTFTTSASIDNNRTVTISGYGTGSLRAVDTMGLSNNYDISTATIAARTQTFKKPGSSTVTVSSDSATPKSANYRVNTTDGLNGIAMTTFNVKSETGDSVITDVAMTVSTSTAGSATGALPTTVYLYDGSTLVGSKTGAAAITFSDLTIAVAKDATKTLTIKADMPSTATNGQSVKINVSSVTYDKPNGTAGTGSGTATGKDQYFFSGKAAVISFSSASINAPVGGTTGTTTLVEGRIKYNIKADGANLQAFAVGGASTTVVEVQDQTGAAVAAGTSTVVVTQSETGDINNGNTITITVDFSADMTKLNSGKYRFAITSIKWTPVGGTQTTQTWGLDDFHTEYVTVVK